MSLPITWILKEILNMFLGYVLYRRNVFTKPYRTRLKNIINKIAIFKILSLAHERFIYKQFNGKFYQSFQ
ncbi:hypothetical protein FACS1894113_5680 [Alphaproteobacteria bacterium]|nr:hypothetical protein FACS1894113_5680 [Alphaproteobacteria bacterium]